MAKEEAMSDNSGLMLVITYFVLFAVNSLVVYLASLWFPSRVVLGTQFITVGWALVHSMGTLALINTFAIPFFRELEKNRGKMLTTMEWMGYYLVLNFIGVWVIARFANQMGFGISSWIVALGLAVVLDVVQGAVLMQVEKFRVKNS